MGTHLPGYEALRSVTPRDIMYSHEGKIEVPVVLDSGGIDGGNTGYTYEIRAGWLLGKITTGGRFRPCTRTLANGAGSSATALIVDNSYPFAVGDSIKIGSGSAVTISAIVYSTHTITLAAARTWSDNDAVIGQDGSQTCLGILSSFAKLKNEENITAVHAKGTMVIQGAIRQSLVLGDLTAIQADTAAKIAGLLFSTDQGL